MQIASSLRRLILPFVASPAVPYFSTLSHSPEKKVIEHNMCVLIFSTIFV